MHIEDKLVYLIKIQLCAVPIVNSSCATMGTNSEDSST
jgi:hypothetical protein